MMYSVLIASIAVFDFYISKVIVLFIIMMYSVLIASIAVFDFYVSTVIV